MRVTARIGDIVDPRTVVVQANGGERRVYLARDPDALPGIGVAVTRDEDGFVVPSSLSAPVLGVVVQWNRDAAVTFTLPDSLRGTGTA